MNIHDMTFNEVVKLLDDNEIEYEIRPHGNELRHAIDIGKNYSIMFMGDFLECIYAFSCDVTIVTNYIYYDETNDQLCAYNVAFLDMSRCHIDYSEREEELGPEDYYLEPEEFEERYGYRPC